MNNIFKLLVRILIKQKRLLIFSVVSLSISLCLVILASTYYNYETSCDKHQSNFNTIKRIVNATSNEVGLDSKYYNTLVSDVSGIDEVSRVNVFGAMLSVGNNVIDIEDLVIVDSSFFKIFDYDIITGSSGYLLNQPNQIVLSQSISNKLFGQENPIGKPVEINKQSTAYVTGVFADIKEKTHLKSDAVVSLYTPKLPWSGGNYYNNKGSWKVKKFSYYLKLNKNAEVSLVEKQIKETYNFPWYSYSPELVLQPLSDIYSNDEINDNGLHINNLF